MKKKETNEKDKKAWMREGNNQQKKDAIVIVNEWKKGSRNDRMAIQKMI